MAEEDGKSSLEMGERLRTWRLFVAMIKWNALGLGALLLLLLLFRTHG